MAIDETNIQAKHAGKANKSFKFDRFLCYAPYSTTKTQKMLDSKTDIIIGALFCLNFLLGWRKGFLRAVAGPVSIFLCLFLGYFYYVKTQSVLIAFAVTLLGPFLLNWIFNLLLYVSSKQKEEDSGPSALSRLSGGCLKASWFLLMVLLFFICYSIIPPKMIPSPKIQSDISVSASYRLALSLFSRKMPNLSRMQDILENPEGIQKQPGIVDSREYRELTNDPRVKELFRDEEIKGYIQKQDFNGLAQHPKFQAILKDPALVKRFITFNTLLLKTELSSPNDVPSREGDELDSDEIIHR